MSSRVLEFFNRHKLLRSNVIVTISCVIGDVLSQATLKPTDDNTNLAKSSEEMLSWLDKRRVAAMAATAGFISGPIGYYMAQFTENLFPGKANASVLKKMVFQTFVSAPIMVVIGFGSVLFLRGKDPQEVQRKLQHDGWRTWMYGGLYWPMINYITFKFVEVSMRPSVGSIAGVAWNIISSNFINRELPIPATSEQVTPAMLVPVESKQ